MSPATLCPASAAESERRSDALFIPEELTPLSYTNAYQDLSTTVRLRYNQLHALYYNEQVAFFEEQMLSPVLARLLEEKLPESLAAHLHEFFDEERKHTAMFRSLNRAAAPEIYADRDSYFVRVGQPSRILMKAMVSRPRLFPLFIWLALIQEERSLHYSKVCLAHAEHLDPRFVRCHRVHLADEIGHLGWDEELLDWLWPATSRALRWMNARLLHWIVMEFFHLPKRSALRVIEHLCREYPELDQSLLRSEISALSSGRSFGASLYSRKIVPRSCARMEQWPEFEPLLDLLTSGVPSEAAQ